MFTLPCLGVIKSFTGLSRSVSVGVGEVTAFRGDERVDERGDERGDGALSPWAKCIVEK